LAVKWKSLVDADFNSQMKRGSRASRQSFKGGFMFGWFCILALAANLLSAQESQEAALGASLAGEVRSRTSVIADSAVHDYIMRLVARLPGGGDLAWQFALIRDDVGGSTHEPLSVPGGHIFVPASLILAANSEAELAGMLAHSMAHTTERRGQVANPSTSPLAFIGGWVETGPAGNEDRASVPLGYLKIQRRNELDADRVAVNTMAGAGYEPAALLEYIRRTQRALTAESRMYSALPPREERIGALETAMANFGTREGRSGTEFKAIQDRVRELAESPQKPPPSLHRKDDQ
jgi:predicted Zn-dependent protease